jgi:DNA repair exonuclease SbcCD nuclease subunit
MGISFLHTADWQIGRPFGGFPAEKRGLLQAARLDAIDRLARAARAGGYAHVLVAGDVLDSATAPDGLIRQLLARLAKHADLVWHLLPGNHDVARPGGVWDRMAEIGQPGHVRAHVRAEPAEIGPGVVLLPAPLTARSSSLDPTHWMDQAPSTPGSLRIGLAHGSVRGFGSEGEAAQLIDPARVASAGLSYLALGDWHGIARIAERVWYSGTPEPDRFPDNEPGVALGVRLDGPAAPPKVERIATGHFHWSRQAARLTGEDDIATLREAAAAHAIPPERRLVELTLQGALALSERQGLEQWLAAWAPTLFHLDADLENLATRHGADDLESLGSGELRQAAERLAGIAADAADPRAGAAGLALRKLIGLAAGVKGGAAP